jgi:hypothetical protein
MHTTYRTLLVGVLLLCGAATIHAGKGEKAGSAMPVFVVDEPVEGIAVDIKPTSDPHVYRSNPPVGIYTTLSGFYNWQWSLGAGRQIAVDPATGDIHVVYMLSTDSANINTSRVTGYAYSTDNGTTWNNFNGAPVPNRSSGYPSVAVGKGPISGAALVANHATVGAALQSIVSVDFPAGQGTFAELLTQPNPPNGSPIWPQVEGGSDGSIMVLAGVSTTTDPVKNFFQRTTDFSNWSTWFNLPQPNGFGGGNFHLATTPSGKVSTLITPTAPLTHRGAFWIESTDNGATWPASSTEVYPDSRIVGPDSLAVWASFDLTYDANENPLMAFNTSRLTETGSYFYAGSRIEFWSSASGFRDAVPWDSTLYPSLMDPQSNHLSLGWPAITTSGDRIVIVFQAFRNDTLTIDTLNNRHFSDIFYVQSGDGGMTWTNPINITNTDQLDERYPSVSKWNPPGVVNIVWQECIHPGAYAAIATPEAPVTRARQVYHRLPLAPLSAEEEPAVANAFRLSQNYPNPFNPATTIAYTIPTGIHVKLAVYNVLGQEVATLVNGYRHAGTYEATLSADQLPSGVYFYTLQAGSYIESRKMVLLK